MIKPAEIVWWNNGHINQNRPKTINIISNIVIRLNNLLLLFILLKANSINGTKNNIIIVKPIDGSSSNKV